MPRIWLSALLLVLAYPPFDLGLLGLVALIPWLQTLEEASPRAAWRAGYWLGVLFFAGTMWWLVYVTVVGFVALVAYLALFFAAVWLMRRPSPWTLVALPSWWASLEYLRSTLLSGLGWNLLAHTQWRGPLLQVAELGGVFMVSWIVALVNVGVWLSVRRSSWRPTVLAVLVLVIAVGYGAVRRTTVEHHLREGPTVRVGLVQGNIPQSQKWDPKFAQMIVERYTRLTQQADLQALYEKRYASEPFVDVMPAGSHPDTRSVRGANFCRIALHRPNGGDIAVVLSVIDNLVKGASGQAVQNMNIMFGFPETAGLEQLALLP